MVFSCFWKPPPSSFHGVCRRVHSRRLTCSVCRNHLYRQDFEWLPVTHSPPSQVRPPSSLASAHFSGPHTRPLLLGCPLQSEACFSPGALQHMLFPSPSAFLVRVYPARRCLPPTCFESLKLAEWSYSPIQIRFSVHILSVVLLLKSWKWERRCSSWRFHSWGWRATLEPFVLQPWIH